MSAQASPTSTSRWAGGNAGGRGAGFGTDELQSLLETLEEHLPLGRDEWELVLSIHNHHFRANNRSVDSLRRKFAALCRSRIPTGNPTCPAEVRTAKRVRYLMTQRADIGDGDGISEADIGIATVLRQEQPRETEAAPVQDATPITASSSGDALRFHDHLDTFDGSSTPSQQDASSIHNASIARPLVGRQQRPQSSAGDEAVMELLRMQILQSQADERAGWAEQRNQREEDRRRWKEERVQRDQERQEDRARREDADRRHEQMMQMMMTVVSAAFRPRD